MTTPLPGNGGIFGPAILGKNVVAPETNILIFGLNEDMDQEAFIGNLADKGIGISQMGPGNAAWSSTLISLRNTLKR